MEYCVIFLLFCVFHCPNVQSEQSIFSKYHKESIKVLLSAHLNDTKYCESILSPTQNALNQLLSTSLLHTRQDTSSNETVRIDSCCRFLHKCNANKQNELNTMNDWNIWHCECVHSFQICLKNLNSSLSNEVALLYTINATKCYAKNHPIIECTHSQHNSDEIKNHLSRFMTVAERKKYFNRCAQYMYDESQPKEIQIVDVPFNDNFMSTVEVWFTQLVYSKQTDELGEVGEARKFKTPEELFEFVVELVKKGGSFGCIIYDEFFADKPEITIVKATIHMKEEDKKKDDFLQRFVKVLVETVCKNLDLINGMEKPATTTTRPAEVASTKTSSAYGHIFHIHAPNATINIYKEKK